MTKPSKAAIAALKRDPSLAAAFNAKFGEGSATTHLHGTVELAALLQKLLEQTKANNARLDEMLDLLSAPKRVVRDADGEIIGVEAVDDQELQELASGSDPELQVANGDDLLLRR